MVLSSSSIMLAMLLATIFRFFSLPPMVSQRFSDSSRSSFLCMVPLMSTHALLEMPLSDSLAFMSFSPQLGLLSI